MVRVSLGFMFLACLGIDLIRQVERLQLGSVIA